MAHDQEVMGSNPGTVYWMDVSGLLAITLKKNWKKGANRGTPKKKSLTSQKSSSRLDLQNQAKCLFCETFSI
jgi:hypothetical protein